MKHIDLSNKVWQWAILIFLAFIWGSSFILMKKGLVTFNSNQVASLRIFFGSVSLLPVSLKHIKYLNKKNWFVLLVVGVVGTATPAYLYAAAQMHITSSLAGMLNSLTPFYALIIAVVFFKSTFRRVQIIGIVLGLIGTMGLVVKDINHVFSGVNFWASLILIATLCYGLNVNLIKNKLHSLKGLQVTSLPFLFIGPISLVFILFSDIGSAIQHPQAMQSMFYIFILGISSGSIALLVFNIFIKYTTTIFAASVTYIIPIFALIWGIIDDEVISTMQFVWISVILLGVYMVNKKHPQ